MEVIVSLHIGKAVDAADDIRSILAETVQNNAQRLFAHLVGGTGNADGAFRSGKGLMAGKEREAIGVLAEQHFAEIAVAETDLALLGNRAGHAERLQTLADDGRGFGSVLHAALDRQRDTEGVCPNRVIKRDRLHTLDDRFHIDALGVAQSGSVFQGTEIIFGEKLFDFVHASLFAFELHIVSHLRFLLYYSSRGSIYFAAPSKRPY